MAIRVVPLAEAPRPAFEHLLRHAWMQNWDEASAAKIIQWRYFDRPPGSATWVVCDGNDCVGLLDSVLRPHLLGGKRFLVRETADWFVLPEYRLGHGLTLLSKIRGHGEPVLVIGGSDATNAVLPRFRFKVAQMARYYVLPVTARGLVANVLRKYDRERFAKLIPSISLLAVRHALAPKGSSIEMMPANVDSIPLPIDPAPAEHNVTALVQIIEPLHWQWLTEMPALMAMPAGLLFTIDGSPVGCSIAQVEPSAAGADGKILHFQYRDAGLGPWIVWATVQFLRRCGVHFIRCSASTSAKFSILEAVGFSHSRTVPVHWYHRTMPPPDLIDAGYLRGDDAMPWLALRSRRLTQAVSKSSLQVRFQLPLALERINRT